MQYSEEKTMERFKKINTDSWESIKDNVVVHLINSKYVPSYDKDLFYKKTLDLAMVFAIHEKDKDELKIQVFFLKDILL